MDVGLHVGRFKEAEPPQSGKSKPDVAAAWTKVGTAPERNAGTGNMPETTAAADCCRCSAARRRPRGSGRRDACCFRSAPSRREFIDLRDRASEAGSYGTAETGEVLTHTGDHLVQFAHRFQNA